MGFKKGWINQSYLTDKTLDKQLPRCATKVWEGNEWPVDDLNSDLTVLSAAIRVLVRLKAGESVMGLPYALFVAGNKNTLLTLWPVDHEATAEFMSRFFTKLKAGNKKHVALSLTKQEFMQHPIWRNLKYWAAFVL